MKFDIEVMRKKNLFICFEEWETVADFGWSVFLIDPKTDEIEKILIQHVDKEQAEQFVMNY